MAKQVDNIKSIKIMKMCVNVKGDDKRYQSLCCILMRFLHCKNCPQNENWEKHKIL